MDLRLVRFDVSLVEAVGFSSCIVNFINLALLYVLFYDLLYSLIVGTLTILDGTYSSKCPVVNRVHNFM
jgi:hypothetical protein